MHTAAIASIAAAFYFSLGLSSHACAQAYPAKPIRVIVGFAPGGSTDTTSRLIAPRLSERLGQQIIVENRPGAQGNIAAELAARAVPDGYTVFMASASHSINASLYPKLSFNAIRDFTAISNVTSSPFVLVVHPSIPARNAREPDDVPAEAKAKLNFVWLETEDYELAVVNNEVAEDA